MNVNTRDLGFINYNNGEMNWVKFNGLVIYEGWKEVTKSGMPPLSLKSNGSDLIKYTMYGNSLQDGVPTPTTPIEIVSVGEKTKNLIDFFNIDNLEMSPQNDKKAYILKDLIIGETYTISFSFVDENNMCTYLYFYDLDENGEYKSEYLTTGKAYYPKLSFKAESGHTYYIQRGGSFNITQTEIDKFATFQLEKGKDATEYEPYGYKIPVKVRGKNLHNSSTDVFGSYINANGGLVADNSSSYSQLIPVKSNTVYGFSCQTNTGISAVQNKRLHAYDKDGNWIQQLCYLHYPIGERGYKSAICTTPNNCSFVRISHIARFEDFIQLEEERVTEYEPYIEPIKTNIYLDEPLRKIGDCVDYIDFENKKIVRVIEKRDCSELEWYQHASYKYVYVFNSTRTKAGTNPMSETFNSTKYQPADSIKNMTTDFCIKAHTTSSATYVSDSVHTTEEEFIEFIKDKTIYYPLKTPAEETIELPSIAMIKGSVVLETDTRLQPSNMEVAYKGKL